MNLTIRCGPLRETVDAMPIAFHFAAHRTIDSEHRYWTLTHVLSGMAIRSDLTSFAEARALAERLAALPVDWNDVEGVKAWGKRHHWRLAFARDGWHGVGKVARYHLVTRHMRRFKEVAWGWWAPHYTRIKDPIALWLNKRPDTCWADLATWTLHHNGLDTAMPDRFWGSAVAGCRKDARVCGACYCGKFTRVGGGGQFEVTSEMTAADEEALIYFGENGVEKR